MSEALDYSTIFSQQPSNDTRGVPQRFDVGGVQQFIEEKKSIPWASSHICDFSWGGASVIYVAGGTVTVSRHASVAPHWEWITTPESARQLYVSGHYPPQFKLLGENEQLLRHSMALHDDDSFLEPSVYLHIGRGLQPLLAAHTPYVSDVALPQPQLGKQFDFGSQIIQPNEFQEIIGRLAEAEQNEVEARILELKQILDEDADEPNMHLGSLRSMVDFFVECKGLLKPRIAITHEGYLHIEWSLGPDGLLTIKFIGSDSIRFIAAPPSNISDLRRLDSNLAKKDAFAELDSYFSLLKR